MERHGLRFVGIEFRYPFNLRALFIVSLLLFTFLIVGVLWVIFTGEGTWREFWWGLLFSMGMAILSGYSAILFSSTFIICDEAVTQARFGIKTRIAYCDVVKSEHRHTRGRYLIYSNSHAIISIEKQLNDFTDFVNLFESYLPDRVQSTIPDLPLTCHMKLGSLYMMCFFVYGGALCIVLDLVLGLDSIGVLGGFLMLLFSPFLALYPRTYTFSRDLIIEKNPLRSKTFNVCDLKSMRLTRNYVAPAHQYVSVLHFQFSAKTLDISELNMAYYIEDLHTILAHHYMLEDED